MAARDERIRTISLPGWQGGLNRQADPYQLELDEVPDGVNVDYGLRGAIAKRNGYLALSTSHGAAKRAESYTIWQELGGAAWHIYVDSDGDLFYMSGTTFTDPTVALGTPTDDVDYPVSFASMNNNLYVSTLRGGNPHAFDGSTWTSKTAAAFDGTSGHFPKASLLVAHRERLFAFNVETSGGTRYRSRFYWSDPALPEVWQALSYIDVAPDNGQEITAAAAFGETIIIFKNRSIYLLSGSDENTFTLYPLDQQIGSISPYTVQNVGAELYFYDVNNGVFKFDGATFDKLDDKISDYIADGINVSEAHKSVGFVYRNRYWLSVPWGADTTPSRTFVYDSRTEAWTEYDYGVAGAASAAAVLYGASPRDSVGIFTLDSGTNDNGSNIDAYAYTAWFSPEDSPGVKNRIRRLDLAMSALAAQPITVEMYRDFGRSALFSKSVNTDPGGTIWGTTNWGAESWGAGVDEILALTSGWGSKLWNVTRFKYAESTTVPFQINRMILQVSTRKRIRGEH